VFECVHALHSSVSNFSISAKWCTFICGPTLPTHLSSIPGKPASASRALESIVETTRGSVIARHSVGHSGKYTVTPGDARPTPRPTGQSHCREQLDVPQLKWVISFACKKMPVFRPEMWCKRFRRFRQHFERHGFDLFLGQYLELETPEGSIPRLRSASDIPSFMSLIWSRNACVRISCTAQKFATIWRSSALMSASLPVSDKPRENGTDLLFDFGQLLL